MSGLTAKPPAKRSRSGAVPRLIGLAAVALFVGLLAYGLIAEAPDTTIDDALAQKQTAPAPGFELAVFTTGNPGPLTAPWRRAARDGRVNLDELRGVPVVVNFWASWCIPCRDEAPLLQRAWQGARRDGVLFVGLNMQDVRGDARGFLREFGQDFPNVRDPTNGTARDWGVTGIPETFFVSRRGDVVGHVIGVITQQQLQDGVSAALAGRPRGAQIGGEQRPTR